MANIYVRKSGNDSNDGSTPELAKLTIENAFAAASNGDIIYIGSGIHHITSGMSDKYLTFYGDINGEYTGDAGEVIIDGINPSNNSYYSFTPEVIKSSVSGNTIYIKNIMFENILSQGAILNSSVGYFDIENCNFVKCRCSSVIKASSLLNINNVIISECVNYSSDIYGIYISGDNDSNFYINNTIIKNLSRYRDGSIYGMGYHSNKKTLNIIIKNSSIENIYAEGSAVGLVTAAYYTSGGTVNLELYNCNFINNKKNVSLSNSYGFNTNCTTYNCNSFGGLNEDSWVTGTTHNNLVSNPNYIILKAPIISKFSPLKGIGTTTFPTTDIDGNPRPAYGNGTTCDIGAVESTSDIIQKESTIKDSGDYSVKVAPCNYFKKTFQVPVTASTLRTVKVKIRIDGTWGTYLPRVSLSGQGMTLSTATKNATTGSFEELTVSGTPTTTGIALLTIEAHSASTDAVLYIDTITIE